MSRALTDRRCAEDAARPQHQQDEQHAIGREIEPSPPIIMAISPFNVAHIPSIAVTC
jgi:hypothetical protein